MVCGRCVPSFMSEPQARDVLGVSKRRMREIVESGELETFTREGSRFVWVTREALNDWEMREKARQRKALGGLRGLSEELGLYEKTYTTIRRGEESTRD